MDIVDYLIYYISVYHYQKASTTAPIKKPRLEARLLRIGSLGWWYQEAQKEGRGYTILWDHLTEYKLPRNKAIAKLDYKIPNPIFL